MQVIPHPYCIGVAVILIDNPNDNAKDIIRLAEERGAVEIIDDKVDYEEYIYNLPLNDDYGTVNFRNLTGAFTEDLFWVAVHRSSPFTVTDKELGFLLELLKLISDIVITYFFDNNLLKTKKN